MMLTPFVAAALAATPYRPLPGGRAAPPSAICEKERKLVAETGSQGIANLPFAMGKRFTTLDSYLAHLQCFAGPIDKPWWRETRPGVYEHVMTATNARPEVVTRAELMKRFGFTR
jgi:hypothetical protein